MGHRQDRQLEPHHAADLAAPQAAGVDDVLAVDLLQLFAGGRANRLQVPAAVGGPVHAANPRVSIHLGAVHAGGLGIRVGHAGGVDVALVGVPHGADEELLVEDRVDLLRLGHRDQLGLHTQVPALGVRGLQPVGPLRRVGKHDAAGDVDAAVLARDLFDLLVQLDRVLLQLGDVRVAVERVHATGRVPGGAGGELGALEQDDVGPTVLREVIEDRGPDHAAADDHYLGVRLHEGKR